MAEYIEREAVLAEMRVSGKAAYLVVMDAPAADVAPVVRCKDCKHNIGHEGNFIQCDYWLDIVKPNGFCSYGKRRDGE